MFLKAYRLVYMDQEFEELCKQTRVTLRKNVLVLSRVVGFSDAGVSGFDHIANLLMIHPSHICHIMRLQGKVADGFSVQITGL